MILNLNPNSPEDYQTYLRIRKMPRYSVRGYNVEFPDEYASMLGLKSQAGLKLGFTPSSFLFDYQRDIARMAVRKEKFAVFADCGLGKTLILLEFARHAHSQGCRTLIVSPLMVCEQTQDEARKFFGMELPIIPAAKLQEWLDGKGHGIAITNYEAIRDGLTPGKLGALVLDESSMLKSHYGKFGTRLIDLGRGLRFKMCLTGTPAPNDRVEYANHAVFLDVAKNPNEFLAKYFINRGQTSERWELRPHALRPFYRDLSHWAIFLTNPATYGWKDNCGTIPPINVHIHRVELTDNQRHAAQQMTGGLFVNEIGGIGQRGKLAQLAKGSHKGQKIETRKFEFICELTETWPTESTIIWCRYNDEQSILAKMYPDAANISGDTPHEKRRELVDDFKAGRRKILISKPKILGFGLNLQICTKQIFSSLQDSYEEYYQAVKRSNRIGSTVPLDVHIPVTELEEPGVVNVLRKAKRVQSDCEEQESLFKESSALCF
jgi:superfamily II DNA or RNA helicase